MAKNASAAAFAVFPKGQNVKWTSRADGQTYTGKVVDFNEEKEKFRIEKKDGAFVLLPESVLKKAQGRPALTEEQKAAKAKEANGAKTQTSTKSAPKAAPAKADDDEEIEAIELSEENYNDIVAAMETMQEMIAENNAEIEARMEKNAAISETLADIIKGLKGHVAAINSEEVEEPSDEEEEEEEKPAPKNEKKKPASLLKRPMAVSAADAEE